MSNNFTDFQWNPQIVDADSKDYGFEYKEQIVRITCTCQNDTSPAVAEGTENRDQAGSSNGPCNLTLRLHVEDVYEQVKQHVLEKHYVEGSVECRFLQCNEARMQDTQHLQRHLMGHAYQAYLQSVGAFVLARRASECQGSSAIKPLSYDGSPLVCQMEPCNYYLELHDFKDYYQHIEDHVTLEQRTRFEKSEDLVCRWLLCDRSFVRRCNMISHVRVHANKSRCACPTCGETFMTIASLEEHCDRQVIDERTAEKCALCGRKFSTVKLLNQHMRKHINRRKCAVCEITVPDDSALRRHMATRHPPAGTAEDSIRAYRCSMCHFSSKDQVNLERHTLAKHSGDKIFNCSVCAKKFAWKSALDMHAKTHDVAQPYECHLCAQRYARGNYLSTHLVQKHGLTRARGFKRFFYRISENGRYRVDLDRFENRALHSSQVEGGGPDDILLVRYGGQAETITMLPKMDEEDETDDFDTQPPTIVALDCNDQKYIPS